MKILVPNRIPSEGRVFSGRIRVRIEPLDSKGIPMSGSKSFIVLETTLDELFDLIYITVKEN